MPLLLAEAQKFSNEQIQGVVVEEIIDVDEVFSRLPFRPLAGRQLKLNREDTLPEAEMVLPNGAITEAAATYASITYELKGIFREFQVDNFIENQLSDNGSQAARQMQAASKAVGRKYSDVFINGDVTANPEEFDGLHELADNAAASQRIDAAGALSYGLMDAMIDQCKIQTNRAFIFPSRTIRAYYELVRNLGGTDPQHITLPGIGVSVPTYRGIPILKNEYIPVTFVDKDTPAGGTNTELYLASMDESEGLAGLMPQTNAGIVVENVGLIKGADATVWRVKWYAGLALASSLALVRADNVTN